MTAADSPFLLGLYASTRSAELAGIPFTDEQRAAFLEQQYEARERSFRAQPGTTDAVIMVAGQPAGRLVIRRGPREIRVVDIAMLPALRGLGTGTGVLEALCRESDAERTPLTLSVEPGSPALRLYERLGFRPARAQPADRLRIALERTPVGPAD